MRSILLGPGMVRPTTMFSKPIRGLKPQMNRSPISYDNDKENHTTLVKIHGKMTQLTGMVK